MTRRMTSTLTVATVLTASFRPGLGAARFRVRRAATPPASLAAEAT